MTLIYRAITTLFYPIIILLIYYRKLIGKEDVDRYKEKIFPSNFKVVKKEKSKLIWFHAASIGELKSIIPIIIQLNKYYDGLDFLVTSITLSSSNIAKEEFRHMENVYHRFFPVDEYFNIKRFLSSWEPKAIFLVDSEIWPNLILCARNKKIPLILINARITKKSYRRWGIVSNFAKEIFFSFDLCLSSNEETTKYLKELNAKNVINTGNLKLISNVNDQKIKDKNFDILKNSRFWFAASTHNGEEKFCLLTHLKIKKKFKEVKTIIAPRHISRAHSIKKLCDNYNLNCQLLNKNELISKDSEIIIINSFGILSNYFNYTKSVFMGKSLIKKLENVSGQNPIDAAKLGCKIYHGSYVYNFQEIYDILKTKGITKLIKNSDELAENLIKDLENPIKNDENYSQFLESLGKKTLNNCMMNIKKLISNENI